MGKFNLRPGQEHSRRNFLRQAGISTALLAGLPAFASSGEKKKPDEKDIQDFFAPGDITLFQGDSITDALRDKKDESPNRGPSFGMGYAYIIAAGLLKELAVKELTFYNRGISGNKVYQLAERWQKDCLELKPDIVSILIGVNDYWHMRQGRYEGTPEIYETDYRELLNRTRKELPGAKLVICEPFILAGTSAVDESWLEPFSRYQEIASLLAGEFETIWVPFQKVFNEALKLAPGSYWLYDGVHPSMAGSRLMADAWLKSLLT